MGNLSEESQQENQPAYEHGTQVLNRATLVRQASVLAAASLLLPYVCFLVNYITNLAGLCELLLKTSYTCTCIL